MHHSSFVSSNAEDCRAMLDAVGVSGIDELFAMIPEELQSEVFDLPDGLSEVEMTRRLRGMAAANVQGFTNYCGAGFYDHFIPAGRGRAGIARGVFIQPIHPTSRSPRRERFRQSLNISR